MSISGQETTALSKRELLGFVPLFARFPSPVLTVLARRCDSARSPAGTVILTEDDRVDHFYVLRTGRVALSQSGVPVRTITERGDTIGLGAVLTRQYSRVTATVITECDLLRFGTRQFWELATDAPDLLPALTAGLATMLLDARPDAFTS